MSLRWGVGLVWALGALVSGCSVGPFPARDAALSQDVPPGACVPGVSLDCDGIPSNGCEVNVLSDPMHCGACGRRCPSMICAGGICL